MFKKLLAAALLTLLASAAVAQPMPPPSDARARLHADTTYYAKIGGNNNNTCLGNTNATACASIQGAIDKIYSKDCNGKLPVIQLVDGTFTTGGLVAGKCVGGDNLFGPLVIQGNNGTPGNVIVSTTGAHAFQAKWGAIVQLKDMELRTTTSGDDIFVWEGGLVYYQNIRFGTTAGMHIEAMDGGKAQATGPYSIVGNAVAHIHVPQYGHVIESSIAISVPSPVTFSAYYLGIAGPGEYHGIGLTWDHPENIIGQKFLIHSGGSAFFGNIGCPAGYIPGTIAGVLDAQTFGTCDYVAQTTFPTLASNNVFTGNLAIGAGMAASAPFQAKLAADLSVRAVGSGGATIIDSLNLAQSGYNPFRLIGSTVSLGVSGVDKLLIDGTKMTISTPIDLSAALGVNGAGTASPFQVKLAADVALRCLSFGAVVECDATNLAQSAFTPLLLSGSTAALAVNGTAALTASGTSVTSTKPIILPVTAVAGLSTCNSGLKGGVAAVNDATAPVYLTTITGGGSVVAPVFCNGTNWVAH